MFMSFWCFFLSAMRWPGIFVLRAEGHLAGLVRMVVQTAHRIPIRAPPLIR